MKNMKTLQEYMKNVDAVCICEANRKYSIKNY